MQHKKGRQCRAVSAGFVGAVPRVSGQVRGLSGQIAQKSLLDFYRKMW